VIYQGLFMSCLAAVAFNRAVALLGPSAAMRALANGCLASRNSFPARCRYPPNEVAIIVIGMGVCLAAKRPSVPLF
jgi:hypothetical protein